MKVFKNLFGNGSKIHVDEIALKHGSTPKLLSDAVIVDSGSNADGSYIRFGDGTQKCWGTKDFSNVAITSAAGAIYYNFGGIDMGSYPKAFIARPSFESFVYGQGDYIVWQGGVLVQPGTAIVLPRIYVMRHSAVTINVRFDWKAVGHWK